MTLPIKKTTAAATGSDAQGTLWLGDSVQSLGRVPSDLCAGDFLSWERAAEVLAGVRAQRAVLVDLAELLSREAFSRHKALLNLCGPGTDLLVVSSADQLHLQAHRGEVLMFPLGFLEQSVSAIKTVLPFEASLAGVEGVKDGRLLLRLRMGALTSPVLDEVIPIPQHFCTEGGLSLYFEKGFYGLEHEAEGTFCWMASSGRILIKGSEAQLIKVELWVEPFVSRPRKLTFGGNEYLLVGKTKITAYRSIISGYNPIEILVDGEAESPLERGLSTDSRKFSMKVVGGKLCAL